MSTSHGFDASQVVPLFGQEPSSSRIDSFVSSLWPSSSLHKDTKSYPDTTFVNYPSIGVSLCYLPGSSGSSGLGLDRIDVQRPFPTAKRKPEWYDSAVPPLPITLHFPSDKLTIPPPKPGESAREIDRPSQLIVVKGTTGRDFVECLGEPTKKGAGGWTGVWLEWARVELLSPTSTLSDLGTTAATNVTLGMMVELKDPGAAEVLTDEQKKHGAGGIWDRAAGWEWAAIKFFKAQEGPVGSTT